MLTLRQRSILKAIVETYIATAEPVGSKSLSGKYDLGVSSATLRNEMAELIAQGYLEQPHTSAGRIPTHKGYRLYVNELMNGYALTTDDTAELRRALKLKIAHYDRLTEEIGQVLSRLTNYAAVTVAPRLSSGKTIRRIDAIPCDGTVFVLLVVLGNGVVRDKVIHLGEKPSTSALCDFLSTANGLLVGLEPAAVTVGHLKTLSAAAEYGCHDLMARLVDFISELAEASTEMEISTAGESNLLSYPEYRDPDRAKELFGFLKEADNVEWLPMPGEAPLVVRIGAENSALPLRDASLMVTGCYLGNGYRGYIGIVGPTRMNYSRLAARLSYFAHGLSAVLGETVNQPEDNKDKGE
ncbi:MAG: heat-inducible transcription repressor HrcA [Ruminococcaceae bacterium]|nr:heat-inducible transcription repressor HrcA [Oscillospiraceae bacterium]MBQ8897713.1 heat-inducible transcription repressor HrcA [Clostridia bacterium]